MNLSDKILKLRKAHGLSQDELSEQLGVSRQSVSKWESGQSTPEPDKLAAMAKVFDVTTDYLLQATATDELVLKTSILEREQQRILNQQAQAKNRQFLIISMFIALVAIAIVFVIGRYVSFPDQGDGYGMLGKTIATCGTLVVISATVYLNWRFRNKSVQQTG